MPDFSGSLPLECGDCGAHFQMDPAGDIQGAACSECGGDRFFRTQPNPTKSDGDLRNMVDMQAGGVDRGGNPTQEGIFASLYDEPCPICGEPSEMCPHTTLDNHSNMVGVDTQAFLKGTPGNWFDEGTIMGEDGERPRGKRDNYMHSKLAWGEESPWINEGPRQQSSPMMNALVQQLEEENPHLTFDQVYELAKDRMQNPIPNRPPREWNRDPLEELYSQPSGLGWDSPHNAKTGMTIYDDIGMARRGLPQDIQHEVDKLLRDSPQTALMYLKNMQRPAQREPAMQGSPIWDSLQPPAQPAFASHTAAKHVEMRELNTEPYAPLWDESYIPKIAGFAAPLLEGAEAVGGDALGGAKAMMPSGISSLMKGVFGGGNQQNAGNTGPQGPPPPIPLTQLGHASIPFLLVSDLETPHSVKSVDEQHDDPEDQDQKEFNDGDKSPSNFHNPNNEDSGSVGEDDVRSDSAAQTGFAENSPGIERAMMILPLLLHYFQSPESGEQDPLIKGLHEMLEGEQPGYLNNEHPDGPKVVEMLMQQHKSPHGVHAGVNAFPSGLPAMPGTGMDSQDPIHAQGKCPTCGAPLAADGSCPNCGMKQNPMGGAPMTDPSAAANSSLPQQHMDPQQGQQWYSRQALHQGPTNPEQIKAMTEAMKQRGMTDMIPDMLQDPASWGWLLNEVQNVPNTPPLVDPADQQSQPPQPMGDPSQMGGQGAPGAMPVIDPTQPGGGGGQPMMPMSKRAMDIIPNPTSDLSGAVRNPQVDMRGTSTPHVPNEPCPQCHGKIGHDGTCVNCGWNPAWSDPNHFSYDPFMEDQWAQDFGGHQGRQAADNAAPRCPKCNSGTTGMRQSPDPADLTAECQACGNIWNVADKVDINKYKANVYLADLPNPVLNTDRGGDGGGQSTLIWKDSNGDQIEPGNKYDLHTKGISQPDHVEVVAKKPDMLDLKLVGSIQGLYGGVQPEIHIKPQDMGVKYTFVPVPLASDEPDPQNLGGMPGMEHIPESGQTTDEAQNTYPNAGTMSHVAADTEEEPEEEDICHRCGNTWVEHTASSETTVMHECARCGNAWETRDQGSERTANVDLSWLEEDGGDIIYNDMDRYRDMRQASGPSRNISDAIAKDDRYNRIHDILDGNRQHRTAGRHFTPGEQRDLIMERGTARNADQLDLEGTHYVTRWDASGKANGLNAPDEHLIMGI